MSNGFKYNSSPSDPLPGVNDLTDTRIRLKLQDIYYYDDDTYYLNGVSNNAKKQLNARALELHPECLKSINFHFSGNTSVGHASQHTSGGSSTNSPRNTFIWSGYTGNGLGDGSAPLMTNTLAVKVMLNHELGHAFGLCHTDDEPACKEKIDPNSLDFLSDIYAPPYTYPDGGWHLDPTSPSNTATNNVMGNTAAAAYLSPLQIGRIRRTLSQHYLLQSYTSGYSEVPLEVDVDETWDFPHKIYQDVVVKSGARLTITCVTTFVSQAKIIIEPGAELILDRGRLTKAKFEDYWQGVYVAGNSSAGQTEADQGKISIINGGEISYALDAISNTNVDSQGNWLWGTTGGIIHCDNAYFLNNRRDVQLLAYTPPYAKNESYNAFFKNCTFLRREDSYS